VSGESVIASSPPSRCERGGRVRGIASSFFSLRVRVEGVSSRNTGEFTERAQLSSTAERAHVDCVSPASAMRHCERQMDAAVRASWRRDHNLPRADAALMLMPQARTGINPRDTWTLSDR
jgi:hypothetical protein